MTPSHVFFHVIAILALRVEGHSLQERNVLGNVLIVDHPIQKIYKYYTLKPYCYCYYYYYYYYYHYHYHYHYPYHYHYHHHHHHHHHYYYYNYYYHYYGRARERRDSARPFQVSLSNIAVLSSSSLSKLVSLFRLSIY